MKIQKKHMVLLRTTAVWAVFIVLIALSAGISGGMMKSNLEAESQDVVVSTAAAIDAAISNAHSSLEMAAVCIKRLRTEGGGDEIIGEYMRVADVYGGFSEATYENEIWYKEALRDPGNIVINKPRLDWSGRYVVTLSTVSFGENGNPDLALAIDVQVDGFKETVLKMSERNGGFGMLVDADYTFFVHPNGEFLGKEMYRANPELSDLEEHLKAEGSTFRPMNNYKGEDSVVYFYKMDNGWCLGFLTPKMKYYAPVYRLIGIMSLVGVAAAVTLSIVLNRISGNDDRRQRLLEALNYSAIVLLTIEEDGAFLPSIVESMRIIGEFADMDRVQLFRNEMIGGDLHFVQTCAWVSDYCKANAAEVPRGFHMPYKEVPEWEEKFRLGGYVNMPLSKASLNEYSFLSDFDVKAVCLIPLYIHNEFWGFFAFDNCRRERTFDKNIIGAMRTVGLMVISTLENYEMVYEVGASADRVKTQAHWYEAILDSLPFPLSVKDVDKHWTFVNREFELTFNRNRANDIGKPCNATGLELCNTERCAVSCARRGQFGIIGHYNDMTYQIDTRILYDAKGAMLGYVETMQDITEKNNLITKQVEADSANKAKSKFIMTISHELRTPLNAIIGVSGIQMRDPNLDVGLAEALEIIHSSGHTLLGIVNDLLDISAIESNKLNIAVEQYDTAKLIADSVQLNTAHIGGKAIEFDLNVDPAIPSELIGDGLRISQVLNNILSNAVKYTPKGRVSFSVEADFFELNDKSRVMIIFKVADTGVGMTPEQTEALFGEYAASQIDYERSVKGVGLGMSITKKLVDLMGGQIYVKSEKDYGTLVTFKLPQGRAGTDEIGKALSDDMRTLNFSNQKSKATHIVYKKMPYKTVLIVDDNETNILVTEGLLAPYEVTIDTATSGKEAIEKIKAGKTYDVILMDHFMPDMDGMETTAAVRAMKYDRPIVALTANAMAGNKEMFLSNGFDEFISKPIDTRQLDAVLKKVMQVGPMPSAPRWIANLSKAFERDAKKALIALEAALAEGFSGDFKAYVTSIHGIKSVLINTDHKEMADEALELEKAARNNDADTLMRDMPGFVKQLSALIRAVESQAQVQA